MERQKEREMETREADRPMLLTESCKNTHSLHTPKASAFIFLHLHVSYRSPALYLTLQIGGNMAFSIKIRLLKNDLLYETKLKFCHKCKGLHTRTLLKKNCISAGWLRKALLLLDPNIIGIISLDFFFFLH